MSLYCQWLMKPQMRPGLPCGMAFCPMKALSNPAKETGRTLLPKLKSRDIHAGGGWECQDMVLASGFPFPLPPPTSPKARSALGKYLRVTRHLLLGAESAPETLPTKKTLAKKASPFPATATSALALPQHSQHGDTHGSPSGPL